jgi:hypothetical protein
MATSNALPGVRRLCALASPLPLSPAAQLVKNSNVTETRTGTGVEKYEGAYRTPTTRYSSLKRRREAREDAAEINKRQQPPRTRLATPITRPPPEPISGTSLCATAPTQSTDSSLSSDSKFSPTPRSGPIPPLPRPQAPPSLRRRLHRPRNYPPAPSTRLHSSVQPRQFSSTSSQFKPALAYHDLVSSILDPTTVSVNVESSAQRGTSTIANPVPESKSDSLATTPSRPSRLPPRPASPYGEINELIRHPTLYNPILKPRHPIVLCHGKLNSFTSSEFSQIADLEHIIRSIWIRRSRSRILSVTLLGRHAENSER